MSLLGIQRQVVEGNTQTPAAQKAGSMHWGPFVRSHFMPSLAVAWQVPTVIDPRFGTQTDATQIKYEAIT